MAEPIARMQHDYDEPSRPMASTRPPLEVVGPAVVTVCSRTDRATRVLNVVVAAIGLVVSMPLWLLIAAAIKLTSRGPVLYSQTRVGIDARAARGVRHDSRRQEDIGGRPFVIYKFRTMRPDAEASGQAVWATSDDDRVTSVGKFLRATRLDELPQLWNVLLGDMNIVGPRPERPQLFKQLREEIPHYQERQRVRPGITGHAQVHLQYDTNIDDVRRKVEHDLEYIATRSLWQDIVIMLKTLPVMLFRKGGW
jgi:lipopolysaccharide/colanic/teichoic acid biosynthesis glycosyltransferase